MPYVIQKVAGGYKVGLASGGKMSNGKKYLSDKPLTKAAAEKQKKAVEMSESKTKINKKNIKKKQKKKTGIY